jgi:anaerobic selenocysteine-containing dehydrogenase
VEQVFTNLTNGGPISVYVKDGKIVRVRPLQVPEEEYKPWVIEAGGKKYSPPKALRLAPPVHAERNRLDSQNRILYPLKRVDFDPNGERNPQNRGKSRYERISWDEALDIVSKEMKRLIDAYGGSAISGMTSSHHNWGIVGYKMGPFSRFMNMLNYTPVLDNPDSWEGWHWGATHSYGFYWRLGMPEQFDLLEDALKHTEMIVFWSNDPDTTRGIGHLACLAEGKGNKDGFYRPVFQSHCRCHGRHLVASAPGLRYGACDGHCVCMDHRGSLRQTVCCGKDHGIR